MPGARGMLRIGVGAILIAGLAGCASEERVLGVPALAPTAPPKITTEQLVGRWGVGAYHRDTDRDRTLPQAKAACSNAYVVTKGENGGVMMHVADSADLFELKVKVSADGRTFIGPDGPPGDQWDREVLSYDQSVLTTIFTDPEVAGRYGTTVFVRCAGR
ncbi:hypothetical protein NK718_07770 [Alsobacter sp. SYSU M60028]|uniref:Lipoprotein n=1 Tax=Alsobacter ponti TaxID=2962936 RepID=A0ABT1LA86_9HYPH|nr:hypothetical protein [Alsobacter ponti]MCP8938410.1 hypothetical protein [Alsobacter ponti]